MESNLALVQNDEFLTQVQMAERLGKSIATVSNRIRALGLQPVKGTESLGSRDGKVAAQYSMSQFAILEEEEAKIARHHDRIVRKHVDGLTVEEKGTVVRETLDSLDINDKVQLAMEAMMSVLQDVKEANTNKDRVIQEQTDRIIYLETELDIARDKMTVETYAIKVLGSPITRSKAGGITRRLHNEGRTDLGKIPSKADPNMPATVWSLGDLDYADAQGWFN